MAFGLFKKKEKQEKKSGSHYFDLTVKEIRKETKDAITLVFEQCDPPISYESGQFLTLIANIDGKEVRRAYSLCTSPFVEMDLAVTIKRVENGLMSNWLPDHLKEGDTLKVMEPMGHFTTAYHVDKKRHLVLFAGGSGITPMLSIIKSLLIKEPKSIVSLIYANRDIDSIIFKDELEQWQIQYSGRLHVIHVLDNAPMNWQGYSGLLNHTMLTELFERIPEWGKEDTFYLMCGPEGMMKNVESLLGQRNIEKEKIFKESFVQGTLKPSPSAQPLEGEKKAHDVTILYDGQEIKITVEPGRKILETALDLGYDLPYSCQSGLCTACRGRAISGKVKLDEEDGLTPAELAEGYVLTCVGHPLTDDVIIEIG